MILFLRYYLMRLKSPIKITVSNVNRNFFHLKYEQRVVFHTAPSPFFPQTGLGGREVYKPDFFQSGYSQSIHHKWDSHITRSISKLSYSFIESQPFPCTPACSPKFNAFTLHWDFFAETVNVFSLLAVFTEELHLWMNEWMDGWMDG